MQINQYLQEFSYSKTKDGLLEPRKTIVEPHSPTVNKYVNEYWTAKQRQGNSLHEIPYRACFKPQLPNFFINLLTKENDIVYDPFTGRGTTIIEAALLQRRVIANDLNPLSKVLCRPRLYIPSIHDVKQRLQEIAIEHIQSEIDLSMFYHPDTRHELLSLRKYLLTKDNPDYIDDWIQMVATTRLTGHSPGFFSVYTLPPNQAVSAASQIKININKKQHPTYRDVKTLILKKMRKLLKDVKDYQIPVLRNIGETSLFLTNPAMNTPEIETASVSLVVTSPPFLDVVQYTDDNWLRCWFNGIDDKQVKLTMSTKIEEWCMSMNSVFKELVRVLKPSGYIAFEVGEVRNGQIRLEDYIVDIGISQKLECKGIMINQQDFTKTANIWGVANNKKGTNSNRIVIFQKPSL